MIRCSLYLCARERNCTPEKAPCRWALELEPTASKPSPEKTAAEWPREITTQLTFRGRARVIRGPSGFVLIARISHDLNSDDNPCSRTHACTRTLIDVCAHPHYDGGDSAPLRSVGEC